MEAVMFQTYNRPFVLNGAALFLRYWVACSLVIVSIQTGVISGICDWCWWCLECFLLP